MESVGDGVINSLYYTPYSLTISRDPSELSGYDESSTRQINIQLLGYTIVNKHHIQLGENNNITMLEARTPLFFNCYIAMNSPKHYRPNTELIQPFLDPTQLNDIILRGSHKASGTAIRHGSLIHCQWEDHSINFKCSTDSSDDARTVIPVITDTQLLAYPIDSLRAMYDHHRCLRSDSTNSYLDTLYAAADKLYQLQSVLPSLVDQCDDLLYNIKEQIDPLIEAKFNGSLENIDYRAEPIVNLRDIVISNITQLAQCVENIDRALDIVDNLQSMIR